jgi:hypothetical protein
VRKKMLAVGLALILLILPLAIRWLYSYEGIYKPGKVTRPDMSGIEAPTPETSLFADGFLASPPGTILVDLAHDNRFEMAELSVLQARLSARGQQIEAVQTTDELSEKLRYSKALVSISPGGDWTPHEIKQIEKFVKRGGRLLLVTDATRFEMDLDDAGSVIFDHDAAHINGLAAQFGVTFQSDYLYNTAENAGNFRNINLTEFGDHGLTGGLDEVVFSAARSIVSEEIVLIATSGGTRSSGSERIEKMPVAVLAADGGALALGDLTFMTEPYNDVSDNNQFIANIADFLSGAQREFGLADFPFFFDEEVDLVYAGNPLLDSDLVESGSDLQVFLSSEGKDLTVREKEDDARDTLFFGLYEQAEEVESYLAAASVTLLITPTEHVASTEEGSTGGEVESVAPPTPEPSPSPSPITEITPALEITVTPAVTVTAEVSPSAKSRMDIEALGEVVLTGTSLLLLQAEEERQVLVVLAGTEVGLDNAVERLTAGNLEDCLLYESESPTPFVLALCPTGEIAPGDGSGGWQGPEPELAPSVPTPTSPVTDTEPITDTIEPPEPVGEPQGSVIVIALDEGEGRYDSMTSAEDYAAILTERYSVTVWSKAEDGTPSIAELFEHDLVIWTAGDFEDAFGDDESELFFLVMLEGIPVIISGAYVSDTEVQSVQRDIQVKEADHPLAEGFGVEDVIGFVAPPSGSEYEISVIEDVEEAEEGVVIFARGPNSEDAGTPSVFVLEDAFSGSRIVFIGFPTYLLPEVPKSLLIWNTVSWLLRL